MDDCLEQARKLLKKARRQRITFSHHFTLQSVERSLSIAMILDFISKSDLLMAATKQAGRDANESKYRMTFGMGDRKQLVIISVSTDKTLNIITGWIRRRR